MVNVSLNFTPSLQKESEISRDQNYRAEGAGADAIMASDTSETGPGAAPELTSSRTTV